ncbi:DUF418 domain-containing protein YeiB [Intestinirhabdus alba]|jgi:uncharacterized protein|uniref:DUF418 domain-containing protein n=1 Tax=Intestinirhabdus alba TaxID=2899544 RepID=A0A6L6IPU4_9ENTR|nr:DUF418 domain-containing protein YeiB [Intestinirhabdus alba]MTH47927.1 DUF418 domain-containing protein [Intestinirhabdus alba]
MTRNVTLDFVRGVALLGILLMNINSFGLPQAAYLNPAWRGVPAAGDAWTWAAIGVIAQGKFLTLFALLFGAGLQMLLPRGKHWIQSRLTLLVLLGFIHALLLWEGDILLPYGLIGLICWRLVRDAASAKSLFNTGVLLYLVSVGVLLLLGMIPINEAGDAWSPGAAAVYDEKLWKLGGGLEAVCRRAIMLADQLLSLGALYGWQLMGTMLTGAALMRSGWLKGQFPLRHYRRTGALLVFSGVVIVLPAVAAQWHLGWRFFWGTWPLHIPFQLAALLQAIGYAALIFGYWPQLCRLRIVLAVACVGRMALTNYLLQTLICTTLFYRFGLFMQFDRPTLLLFVLPVWLVNILFSAIWLRFYRQGPVEWLWRQLTRRTSGSSLPHTYG